MYNHVCQQGHICMGGGGGGGGARHKIMPYSDNGLLKLVIIFPIIQHLSMAAYIFPQTYREGDRPPPPALPLNTALVSHTSSVTILCMHIIRTTVQWI